MTDFKWNNHNFNPIASCPKRYLGLQIVYSLFVDGKEIIPPKPSLKFKDMRTGEFDSNGQKIKVDLLSHMYWGGKNAKCTLKINNEVIFDDKIHVDDWPILYVLGIPCGLITGIIITFPFVLFFRYILKFF